MPHVLAVGAARPGATCLVLGCRLSTGVYARDRAGFLPLCIGRARHIGRPAFAVLRPEGQIVRHDRLEQRMEGGKYMLDEGGEAPSMSAGQRRALRDYTVTKPMRTLQNATVK